VCRGQQQQGSLTNNNQPKKHRRGGGEKGEEVQPRGSVGEVRYAMTFQGDNGYKDGDESIILSLCSAESMILPELRQQQQLQKIQQLGWTVLRI
jgi:hypothetical protein